MVFPLLIPLAIGAITAFSGVASVVQAVKEGDLKQEVAKQNQLIEQASLAQERSPIGFLSKPVIGNIPLWVFIAGGLAAIGVAVLLLRR